MQNRGRWLVAVLVEAVAGGFVAGGGGCGGRQPLGSRSPVSRRKKARRSQKLLEKGVAGAGTRWEDISVLNLISCWRTVGLREKGCSSCELQDNIDLFYHTRNNIFSCLSSMSSMPGVMSQMPPLPISVNDELLYSTFPHTSQAISHLFSPHGDSVLKEELSGGTNLL